MTPYSTAAALAGAAPIGRPAPVRVLLHDDDELSTYGLSRMLGAYPSWVQPTGTESPAADVILFDWQRSGSGHVRRQELLDLIERQPDAKVAIFTCSLSPQLMSEAFRAGVAGYLSKGMSASDLVSALVRISRGERLLSPAEGGEGTRSTGGLTEREAAIAADIAEGMSNDEIAEHEHLSVNTVKSYIRSAYRKMGVSRRSQAVLWAHEHGLTTRA